MGYNKIIYGNKTLLDLTSDTVSKDSLVSGYTAHNKSGNIVDGELFSNYPNEVTINQITPLQPITKQENNIVVYNGNVLIDLSNDTVTEETLLWGYRCHRRDGTIIDGTFLKDYPNTCGFEENILDSDQNNILDSNEQPIEGQILYTKTISNDKIIYSKI